MLSAYYLGKVDKSVQLCVCTLRVGSLRPALRQVGAGSLVPLRPRPAQGEGALHAQAVSACPHSCTQDSRGRAERRVLESHELPEAPSPRSLHRWSRRWFRPARRTRPSAISLTTPLIPVPHQPHPRSSPSSFYFYFGTCEILLWIMISRVFVWSLTLRVTFLEIRSHVPPILSTAPSIVLTISTQ